MLAATVLVSVVLTAACQPGDSQDSARGMNRFVSDSFGMFSPVCHCFSCHVTIDRAK